VMIGFSDGVYAEGKGKKVSADVEELKHKDKKEKKEKKEEKAANKAEKKEEKREKKEEKAENKAEKKEYKEVKHSKTADEKELGRDEKGRMIYEGPRGGQYYYTDHGTKVYLKEENKK